MSLAAQISSIRARGQEALRQHDGEAALALLASNLIPMCNSLERLNGTLKAFGSQRWAKNHYHDTCADFGVKPSEARIA